MFSIAFSPQYCKKIKVDNRIMMNIINTFHIFKAQFSFIQDGYYEEYLMPNIVGVPNF